ncbi:MAG: hypothetical protein ABI068_01855 [Ktedonobacterales bacterium]
MGETDETVGMGFPMSGQDRADRQGIWLRQSITFTVDGQTRTLEIALPLRPGASAAEIETLLDEAEAAMRRLTQRLNTRVAEILTTPMAPTDSAAIAPATPSAPPSMPESTERTTPAPAIATPRPTSPSAPARPTFTSAPERAAISDAEQAPVAPNRSAPRTPAAQSARPPAPPAATAVPAAPAPTTDLSRPEFLAETANLGLTPKQVMERLNVRSLNGLNLREALEALRRQIVRAEDASTPPSSAHSTPAGAPRTPAPGASSAHAPQRHMPPAPTVASAPTRYGFDEEDDLPDDEPELTFTLEDTSLDDLPDDLFEEGSAGTLNGGIGPVAAGRGALGAPDELDELDALLADVNGAAPTHPPAHPAASTSAAQSVYASPPGGLTSGLVDDFDEPDDLADPNDPGIPDELADLDDLDDEQQYIPDHLPPAVPPVPAVRPGSGRSASVRTPQASQPLASPTPGATDAPASAGANPSERSRTMQIIGQLRGVRGGGASTAQQRLAYRNIVITQIGDLDATNLIRLVWRISSDRLGADQLDALIRWGKEDNFGDEVPQVLTVLRAEREREAQTARTAPGGQGAATTPTSAAPAQPPAAARPSSRTAATPRTGATRPDSQRRPATTRGEQDAQEDR